MRSQLPSRQLIFSTKMMIPKGNW